MKILSFDVGIINLAYCIFDSTNCKIIEWEVITLNVTTNVNNLYINLINQLDLRKYLLNVDTVLIEKQPSLNPKMRIIAGCLQTYFFIRGVIDLKTIHAVEFFSPKNKLKCYTGPELVVTGKGKYSQTKKMGVLIARSKLNEFSESMDFKDLFEKSKKKDDLADCYIQAVTWCSFKKILHYISPGTSQESVELLKSKVVIKKNLKELLELSVSDEGLGLLEFMNSGISQILQKSIIHKFSISFPITIVELDVLFGDLNMKGCLKKNYLANNCN